MVLAVWIGLCLGLLHLAYFNVFYLAGRNFGVWCPLTSPPVNILATPMPWIEAVETGLHAAIDEEFTFRLFAIMALLRLTGRPWLAITLPALVWGFLHTPYPQDPAYIRGVELTVAGIVYGAVMLRYGLPATLAAHYTYNAAASGGFLISSGRPVLAVAALLAIALPLLIVSPGLLRLAPGIRPSFRRFFPPLFGSSPAPCRGPQGRRSGLHPVCPSVAAPCYGSVRDWRSGPRRSFCRTNLTHLRKLFALYSHLAGEPRPRGPGT